MRTCAPLLACLLLASLYGGAKTVQPFAAGKVMSRDPGAPKKRNHFLLAKVNGGAYRLTNNDKASSDFGDAVVLHFFALSGVPKDVFVFEAVSDDKCRPGDICHPMTAKSERDYGLVRLTKAGAEVTSPDCDKSSAAAKLPGVSASDYGTCTFTSRASLETALLAQARQGWKASIAYNYE